MDRVQINLRLDIEDLGRWQKAATEEEMSLSAWIREKCNGATEDNRAERVRRDKEVPSVERVIAASGRFDESLAKPKVGACAHGVENGWRCTLCGGIVK